MSFLLIPALLILMYFVLLRPQQQRLRRQRELVSSLEVGDEIVTAGGMIGTIVSLDNERAEIEVADGVTIEFLRAAISRKLDESAPRYGAYQADDEYASEEDGEEYDEQPGEHEAADHEANHHEPADHDAASHDAASHEADGRPHNKDTPGAPSASQPEKSDRPDEGSH
jgi:preprotein translocase subunit YajC